MEGGSLAAAALSFLNPDIIGLRTKERLVPGQETRSIS